MIDAIVDDRKKKQLSRLMLAVILLVATALRIWGLDFGLPLILHPDEAFLMRVTRRIVVTNSLDPKFLNYPSLMFDVHALGYAIYFAIGKAMGLFQSIAQIPASQFLGTGIARIGRPSLWLMGRAITATFGVGIVWVVYHAARCITPDRRVALLAALFAAVNSDLLEHSRYITADTLTTVWSACCMWATIIMLRKGRLWNYLVAGLFAGLAASTKYNAAVLVGLPVLATLFSNGRAFSIIACTCVGSRHCLALSAEHPTVSSICPAFAKGLSLAEPTTPLAMRAWKALRPSGISGI